MKEGNTMKKTYYSYSLVNPIIAIIGWGLVIKLFEAMNSKNFASWEPYFLYGVVLLISFITIYALQFTTFKDKELILSTLPFRTTIRYEDIIQVTKDKPKSEMYTYIYITYSDRNSKVKSRVMSLAKKNIEDEFHKRMIPIHDETKKNSSD